jgi:hypothetical protein
MRRLLFALLFVVGCVTEPPQHMPAQNEMARRLTISDTVVFRGDTSLVRCYSAYEHSSYTLSCVVVR